MTAPEVYLPDVGLASFGQPDGVQLETVHGRDDRMPIKDTDRYPWSAVASLMITAADGSQWLGTDRSSARGPRPPPPLRLHHAQRDPGPRGLGAQHPGDARPGRRHPALRRGDQHPVLDRAGLGGQRRQTRLRRHRAPVPLGDTSTPSATACHRRRAGHQHVNIAGSRATSRSAPPGSTPAGSRPPARPKSTTTSTPPAGKRCSVYPSRTRSGPRRPARVRRRDHGSGTRISPPVFSNLTDWKA